MADTDVTTNYGFWVDDAADEDYYIDEDLPKFEAGCIPDSFTGDCYTVTDHGNVSFVYAQRGDVVTEHWAIV